MGEAHNVNEATVDSGHLGHPNQSSRSLALATNASMPVAISLVKNSGDDSENNY